MTHIDCEIWCSNINQSVGYKFIGDPFEIVSLVLCDSGKFSILSKVE